MSKNAEELVAYGTTTGDNARVTKDGSGTIIETLDITGAPSFAGGAVTLTEVAAPTGVSGKDILYADSTAHRLKMKNNNGSADTVVGAATTDTLTNKTISGGSYVDSVVPSASATPILTAAQSGGTFLFDRGTGVVYTLPAPQVGLTYTFIYSATITSGAAEIDTDAGTTFLLGAITMINSTDGSTKGYLANGSSIVKISSDGATKGGIKGGQITLTCISSTVWEITGIVVSVGGSATPFA